MTTAERGKLIGLSGQTLVDDKPKPAAPTRAQKRQKAKVAAKPLKRWKQITVAPALKDGKTVGLSFIFPEPNCYVPTGDIGFLMQLRKQIDDVVRLITANKPVIARSMPTQKPLGA